MNISVKAKERFCRDCNIPIRLFHEPYFMDRLTLFDKFYGTLEKWNVFVEELQKYHCEQDYFEEYNRVKDAAINSIKETEAYQRFNNDNMNQYIIRKDLPKTDIFKTDNDGRIFVSVDMRKANFSSLYHYDKDIFSGASTWEEFIGRFTSNKHIINSKYIRQVILGNCNPGRHITYEKYIMNGILEFLTKSIFPINKVVFFSNDEIVVDITDYGLKDNAFLRLQEYLDNKINVPVKVEIFKLHKIINTDGYYKEIFKENGETEIEFKCLDNYMMPFVLRTFLGEEITENDKVFYHEKLLAKFIDVPNLSNIGGVN